MIALPQGPKQMAHGSPKKRAPDPRYELLEHLSEAKMPYRSEAPEVIGDLMSLHAAGLIEGEMPQSAWHGHVHGWSGPAVVHRLTKLGFSVAKLRRT